MKEIQTDETVVKRNESNPVAIEEYLRSFKKTEQEKYIHRQHIFTNLMKFQKHH